MKPHSHSRKPPCIHGIMLTLLAMSGALMAEIPPLYRVMEDSESPDGKWAVLEPGPDYPEKDWDRAKNQLVRVSDGTVLGNLEGVTGKKEMNHGGSVADWAPSGRLLLWTVDGKWAPRTVTLVAVEKEKITRQLDLVKASNTEILRRTREAFPKAYAAAVKQNASSGAAFPEGFTVCVSLNRDQPEVRLPFRFVVTLNSNVKGIEDYPEAAEVTAHLFGRMDETMTVKWGSFKAYDAEAARRLSDETEGQGEGLAHALDALLEALPEAKRAAFTAEQDAWDKAQSDRDEGWPVAESASTTLSEQMLNDATRARLKVLNARLKSLKR